MSEPSPPPSPPSIPRENLDLSFPDPGELLFEGPGETCSWQECMRETAAQTRYYLEHYNDEVPSPPQREPFRLH